MSLRALPLIVFAFLLYNVIVFLGGGDPVATLQTKIFQIPMISKAVWVFTWGDFIMLLTLMLLFIELLKSTYTSTASLLDHGLSMLVFVVCLIEFIIVPQAVTSTFFMIMIATLIDVVAGYTIGIRVARRDLNIGGEQ
jgi:hypothetical protein